MSRRLPLLLGTTTTVLALISLALLTTGLRRIPSNALARRSLLQNPPYTAPMRFADDPDLVPHTYLVSLHPGHSREEHWRAIGNSSSLHAAITHLLPEQSDRFGLHYVAHLDDDALAAVRADIGVDTVECEGMYSVGYVAPPLPCRFYEREMEQFSARLAEEQRARMQGEGGDELAIDEDDFL